MLTMQRIPGVRTASQKAAVDFEQRCFTQWPNVVTEQPF
jgi:hypothetical protein